MADFTDLIRTLLGDIDLAGNDVLDARSLGLSNDTLRMHQGNDTAYGGDGRDTFIDGGIDSEGYLSTGFDRMYGGSGDDLFLLAETANFVNGGEDTDTVSFQNFHYGNLVPPNPNRGVTVDLADTTRFVSVENLTGSNLDDVLQGTSDRNTINGGRGYDRIDGRGGNDRVNGGEGNDTLTGGTGRDTLTGGGDRDTFVFNSTADSNATNGIDLITDFVLGRDRIDLRAIDANGFGAGDTSFTFIGFDDAFDTSPSGLAIAGQLRLSYDAATNTTLIEGNTDLDLAAELSIRLTGNVRLASADFLL